MSTFQIKTYMKNLKYKDKFRKNNSQIKIKGQHVLEAIKKKNKPVIFVSGQSLAWQELNVSGYFLSSNPANTFFYLITALHAFHILGGLVAWVMVTFRVFKGDAVMLQPQSIGLLGAYWHYMLLVWGILFAMLITT